MKSANSQPVSLFQWIWRSYLRTSLIPLVLVELVFIGIYFFSNNWSQQEMINVLRQEVNTELHTIAQRESAVLNEQLLSVENAVELYRSQISRALQTPAEFLPEDKERLEYSSQGVFYTVKDKPLGGVAVFYSGAVTVGETQEKKVAQLLRLEPLMKDLKRSHRLIDSLYFNTFDSLNIIYPYFDVISQFPALIPIPTYNFYYEADAQHNPQRQVKWTDAYLDPAGHGWMASAIAPVYNGDFLQGVAGIDITISTITKQMLDMDIPWKGYGVLVGKDGTILALPPQGEKDWGLGELTSHTYNEAIIQDTFKPDQFNLSRRAELGDLWGQIAEQSSGMGNITLNQERQVVSWATVPDTGWKFLIFVAEKNVYAQINTVSSRLLSIGMWMIGGLVFFYSIFFAVLYRQSRLMSSEIALPLAEIDRMVQQIGAGRYLQQQPEMAVRELQETAARLITMAEQIGRTNENLLVAQKILKQQETDLQALVHSIDDVIFEVDEQGIYRNVWARDEQLLAKPVQEMLGQPIEAILDEGKAILLRETLRDVFATGLPQAVEYRLETARGNRWFQARIALIAKETRAVSVSVRDITDRKEMEQSLVLSKTEAEEANMAKSQFLSNMSHELRTPLNAIMGFAQLLEFDGAAPLTKMQRESVREIINAGDHLLHLINEVLDLAKIESGKLSLSLEPIQVQGLVDETVALIRPLAEQNNIELICSLSDWDEQFVAADRTRLKQVLLNLLSNAVKYNRPGGTVKFTCEQMGQFIRFHVVDTGHGIERADLQMIFEPFHRLTVTAHTAEGTGIGLAVAKQLVQYMGGSIGVDSVVGQGSHFWLDLAVADRPEQTGITAAVQPEVCALVERRHKGTNNKVLYIEDNPANMLLVKRLVARHAQVDMLTAVNGEQGLAAAAEHQPQLILLDINLPDIDGITVLKRLKQNETTAAIPVVAMSANAMANDIEKGLTAGFADYMTKPINVPKFLELLARYLAAADN